MTFACEVKNEIAKSGISLQCCAIAELYGILLVCNVFSHTLLKITTENAEIAKRISVLFKKAFNISILAVKKNNKYIFELDNPFEISKIFHELGYDHKYYVSFNLNENVIDNECCMASFLKGLFLMSGTVASPDKKTHLEISIAKNTLAQQVVNLMNKSNLTPKESLRKSKHIIYFKNNVFVTDFLIFIGASKASMKIMEAKIEKELINRVNRRVNCETANLTKMVDTAHKQNKLIKSVIDKKGIDIFPEKLQYVIKLRLDNPELGLTQIGLIHNPPITKSAINHKVRKIMQIAKENDI